MKNRILVVIDMQEDFVDGVLGSEAAQNITKKVGEYIANFDGFGVLYTLDSHEHPFYNDTIEGQRIPFHCPLGEDGWFLVEDVQEGLDIFEKRGGGRFIEAIEKDTFGSDLELVAVLNEKFYNSKFDGNGEIILCGLCTDICVVSNALILRAAFPYAEIKVIEDCCAGTSKENHEAALTVMKANCIDVVGADYAQEK